MKAEGGWAVGQHRVLLDPSRERRPARHPARLWDESDVRNLSLMCERVHEHDALAGVELNYGGAHHTRLRDRAMPARGVSQIPSASDS